MLFVELEALEIAWQRLLSFVGHLDGQLVAGRISGLLNGFVLSGSIQIDRLLFVTCRRIKIARFRITSGQRVDVLSAFPFDEITRLLAVVDCSFTIPK